jgi:uncharacterized protein
MRLSGLYVYPIKACGGIALEQANVVERGLEGDRRYLIVDRNGRFITQREMHSLSLVRTELDGRTLRVRAPSGAQLELPRELAESAEHEPARYRVWDSEGNALRHAAGSRFFSEYLNADVSLLYMPESERRAVNPARGRPGDIVSFADGYPMLLISEASLSDLNARLDEPLEMLRFRPNLVIAGTEPYAEDGMSRVTIGDVTFRGVKRCDRCVVTTIDPQTGELGKEPLRTLAKYRKEDGKVWFGMNLIHDGTGTLRLGDAVYSQ